MSIMSISNIIHLLLHNIWVVAQFGGHARSIFSCATRYIQRSEIRVKSLIVNGGWVTSGTHTIRQ